MRALSLSLSQICTSHANMNESKIEKDLLQLLLMFLSPPERRLRVGQRVLSCVPSLSLPHAATTTTIAAIAATSPSSNVCTSHLRPQSIHDTNSIQKKASKSRTQTPTSKLRVKMKRKFDDEDQTAGFCLRHVFDLNDPHTPPPPPPPPPPPGT